MKAASFLLRDGQLHPAEKNGSIDRSVCQLVLGFGDKEILTDKAVYEYVRQEFPAAQIALCSTAGEIFGTEVHDHSLSLVALQFVHTEIKTVSAKISDYQNSYEAGAALVHQLSPQSLQYIFILSDGGQVNGSELVRGMESIVKHTVPITGGLAGDGGEFVSTLVGLNAQPSIGTIVAIGFYGDRFKVSHGSQGGWDVFGLERPSPDRKPINYTRSMVRTPLHCIRSISESTPMNCRVQHFYSRCRLNWKTALNPLCARFFQSTMKINAWSSPVTYRKVQPHVS